MPSETCRIVSSSGVLQANDLFGQLVEELAVALRREDVTYVVGDAVEGVNPGQTSVTASSSMPRF